ncbi:MAG: alpha-amylase family glycosyl hydrolase [Bacteroidota bacterium]
MYQQFGANVSESTVTFQLFFPDNQIDPTQYRRGGSPKIKEIRIRGNFQAALGGENWAFETAPIMQRQAHPKGWVYVWSSELPEGFYEYKYFVTFENESTRWCTDPYSRYSSRGQDENSAFVIGGNDVIVQPISKRLPSKDWIIYEMMIDDFTAEFRGDQAPIDAIFEKLDHLEQLGINAIEFMPWTAWPGGSFSWGYDPFQFFSVEYRYINDDSTPCDKLFKLKTLINELHDRNIHVIMDGVFNHVNAGINPNRGFGYRWLYQDPEDSPFIGGFERGGFFEELDYENLCTQEFIRDVCIHWLDEYQLDGIRFDYTLGFYRESDPSVGISRLISDVQQHVTQENRTNIGLFVEHLTDNRYEAIDDANQINASGAWFDPFMFTNWQAANGVLTPELLRIQDASRDFAPDKSPVTYTQNHDHSNILSVMGGRLRWYKSQAPAISLLTSPGAIMLHNGQEFGEDYFLPASGPDRVIPRPLRWEAFSADFIGGRLFEVYQRLIEIRKVHPALRSSNYFPHTNHPDGYGIYPDLGVSIYHRWGLDEVGNTERFIIALNYSDTDHFLDIPFSTNGNWIDLLNQESVRVEAYRLFNYPIPSNWGRIFFQLSE